MSFLTRTLPLLAILVAAALLMGANPFKGETLAPTDLLLSRDGWATLGPKPEVRHPFRSDVLDYKLPSWVNLKEQLHAGQMPLWNDLAVNGVPGLQLVTRSAITPAFLTFLVIEDDATGFYLSSLVNLLIAAIGMYLFLRQLSLNRWSSLFGAFVFAFSGFHAAWFYWHHVNTSIWLPWLLFAVAAYLEREKPIYLSLVAASGALMLLGGFPAVAMYGFIAAGLMTIVLCWAKRGNPVDIIRIGWPLAVAVSASLLLSWFAIASLLEQLAHTAVEYRGGGSTIRIEELSQFFTPGDKKVPRVGHSFYLGLPAVLLSIIGIGMLWKRSWRPAGVFALLLLVITITIVFALVPKDWIRMIPGFQLAGSWVRMSVLFGVSIAILSAMGLTLVMNLVRRVPAMAILIAISLIITQLAVQKTYFQRFNSPAPANTFLASTPTIDHVAAELGDLQSVTADSRLYLPSGTLGSYGIAEWFAHDFKSPDEKESLTQLFGAAFSTATASVLDCNYLKADARLLSLYGVRFVLCPNPRKFRSRPTREVESSLLNDASLEYEFVLDNQINLQGVALPFRARGLRNHPGALSLQLRDGNGVVTESLIDVSAISDDDWTRFEFPEALSLPQGTYSLYLHWQDATPGGNLRLKMQRAQRGSKTFVKEYTTSGQLLTSKPLDFQIRWLPPANKRLVERRGQPSGGNPAMHESEPFEGLEEYRLEPKVRVFENIRMGDSGAYFLAELQINSSPDFSAVDLIEYRPGHVELEYMGDRPGWIVLPIRDYPGWQTRVNDELTDADQFLDIMPAIPVSGASSVTHSYSPQRFSLNVVLSAIGWLGLLLLTAWFWRSSRRSPATG